MFIVNRQAYLQGTAMAARGRREGSILPNILRVHFLYYANMLFITNMLSRTSVVKLWCTAENFV